MHYLFDNKNDNYTDLYFSAIRHNQFLDGQDKFPDFDLREILFHRYSHPPHILQAKIVVLWTMSYQHVIITTDILDRNGEITVQTEDGKYKGIKMDYLLWIEHFAPISLVDHKIKRCTILAKNAERFCGLIR